MLGSTAVVDAWQGSAGWCVLAEHEGAGVEIQATSLIIATGARERFLPFPGWTLPNVFGIGGAQALLKNGTTFRGKRVVIAGSGPLLLPVAASLARSGARLALVAEQAGAQSVRRFAASLWRKPGLIAQAVGLRSAFIGTPYRAGTWVTSAEGDDCVRSVTVTDGSSTRTLECDVLCAAFGLVPTSELARLLGCACEQGAVQVDARQETSVRHVYCAGEPTGIGGVDLSIVEGEIAGLAAAGRPPTEALVSRRTALQRYAARLRDTFALRPELFSLARPDTIVCRCEDVRLRDLEPGWSARQTKLYTRAGMGACQGRICGGALESIMGRRADTVRPPIQPARLATFLVQTAAPAAHHGARDDAAD